MNVGFYLTSGDAPGYVYADSLVRSIRRTMPDVPVHQFTDLTSPSVWGIDATHRLPQAPLAILRSEHYASVTGEWLFMDTDCMVQHDVRDVFNGPFDIAVTDRNWPHLPPLADSFTSLMPYCAGVVFSRCPLFWERVHALVVAMPIKEQKWFADQKAMCDLLAVGAFPFKVLAGSRYQFPPAQDGLCSEDADIVHYKGPDRKKFLMARIHQELALA